VLARAFKRTLVGEGGKGGRGSTCITPLHTQGLLRRLGAFLLWSRVRLEDPCFGHDIPVALVVRIQTFQAFRLSLVALHASLLACY